MEPNYVPLSQQTLAEPTPKERIEFLIASWERGIAADIARGADPFEGYIFWTKAHIRDLRQILKEW